MITFWSNRAAKDHVLIMAMDVNSEIGDDQNEFLSPAAYRLSL
jgi:hypothetical protein